MNDEETNDSTKITPSLDKNTAIEALEVLKDGVLLLDLDGNIKYVNKNFEKKTGHSREKLIGKDIDDVIEKVVEEEDLVKAEDNILKILGGLTHSPIELDFITKEGEKIPASITVSYIRDDEGEPTLAVVSGRDITRNKEAMEYLRESEERYRELTETMQEILICQDIEGEITFANKAASKKTGYSENELLNLNIYDLIPEDEMNKLQRFEDRRKKYDRSVINIETKVSRKDGALIPVIINSTPMVKEGEIQEYLMLAVDITERKRAEKEIKRSRKKIRELHRTALTMVSLESKDDVYSLIVEAGENILDFRQCCVSLMDGDGYVVKARSSEEDLRTGDRLGREGIREKVYRSGEIEIMPDVQNDSRAKPFQDHYRSGITLPLNEDGIVQIMFDEVDAFDQQDIELAELLVTHADEALERIDKKQELLKHKNNLEEMLDERTKELKEINGQLKSFSFSVSHDLKAPLRALSGFSAALIEDHSDDLDEDGQELVKRISSTADRMDTLIEDLLKYSRLTRSDLEKKSCDPKLILTKVLKNYRQEIEQGDIVNRLDHVSNIMAHRGTLKSIFNNLINNATKFTDEGTSPILTIRGREEDNMVRLEFEDNGIGIPKERQDEIFEMFHRLHGREVYPGTGAGLAIVKKGVERMGGEIGVESELGQGSTFWLRFQKG